MQWLWVLLLFQMVFSVCCSKCFSAHVFMIFRGLLCFFSDIVGDIVDVVHGFLLGFIWKVVTEVYIPPGHKPTNEQTQQHH